MKCPKCVILMQVFNVNQEKQANKMERLHHKSLNVLCLKLMRIKRRLSGDERMIIHKLLAEIHTLEQTCSCDW